MRWDVASVALATVLLHKKPFETLQEYGNECHLMKHRILAQSKGLIELEEFGDPIDARWALVDISTGQKRTDPVLETEYNDWTRYDTIALQWVHRSAYDCILNSPSGGLAASLRSDDEARLARETLAAVVWLSKHVPHVVVESGGRRRLNSGVWKAVVDMSNLSDIPGIDLGDDVMQALDELLAAIMSSLYTEDKKSLCRSLSGLLDEADQHHGTWLPLWQFWAAMAGFPDVDRFILPRLESLEQSAYPHRPMSVILMWISQSHKGPWDQLPAVWHKAVDFLTRQTGAQSRAASIESLDGTGEFRNHMLSFLESGTVNEDYFIISALDAMCSTIQEGSDDTGWEAVTKLLEVCEAWDIYHGDPTEIQPDYLSPLQMQVPQSYANVHLAKAPDPFKSRWRRRTLRLLCLDPKQVAETTLLGLSRQRINVTAYFDISEQCSNEIGELVVDEQSPFGDFTESMGKERCLQLILNDIWEDPDGQLDAWQRLYVRAYVRKWFKYLWVRRAGK